MKLMMLLCKTLYRAWFDVYDARHKQKLNSFYLCSDFPLSVSALALGGLLLFEFWPRVACGV